MKSSTRTGLLSSLAAAAMVAVAVTPAGANRPGYSLTLSGPSTVAVGKPFTMTVMGIDPLDTSLPIPAVDAQYLDVVAIPTGTTATCPGGYETAIQLASSTGGTVIAQSLNEDPDSAGNFSMTVGYTPDTPGQMLICAYTEDALTATYATASLMLTVASGGGTRPTNVTKPRITRSGEKLTCKPGTWSHQPHQFAYAWLVNGKAGPRLHGAHLAVTPQLRGRTIRCSVTASNTSGAATATSPPFFVR